MHSISINDRVEKIKNSEEEINRLVEEYKPFIASCVQQATGKFVRYGEDDELSVAMMAFVEAIKSYSSARGNFLPFAQNVIKLRLIDYYRKEKKHSKVVSINQYTGLDEDDDKELDLTTEQSINIFSQEELARLRRQEIEQLKKELAQWDISFSELADASPKAEKTKRIYRQIIDFIVSQPDIIKQIKQKKYIPIAEIEKETKIHRKKIERARKYIIAVVLIRTGDYQYIRDYVQGGC